jgi:hypothetical protein
VQVLGALYAGDSTYSIAVSSPATVTVKNALVSTMTSVAASALNGTSVTPVTFTMSVVGNSGTATPAGNFKLALDGQTLAIVAVGANGTASYSATLSAGTGTVAATYSGDANYTGSTASPVTLTIVPAPDVTLAAAPGSAAVVAGQSAGFNISLASEDGFAQAVTFACSGLPAGASCSFAPSSVTPGTSPAQTTLTIATTSSSASASPRHRRGRFWPETGGAVALALLAWPLRRRRWLNLLIVAAALATGTTLTGCGGGAPMQSTSTVVVTATGGGVTHTLNLSLTVTQ